MTSYSWGLSRMFWKKHRRYNLELDFSSGIWVGERVFLFGAVIDGAKFTFGEFNTPFAKCAFGKFHNIAFVDDGHGAAIITNAYSIAARISRCDPLRETGLIPMPHSSV